MDPDQDQDQDQEVDKEIEQHLIQKIDDAIKNAGEQMNLLGKIVPFKTGVPSDFTVLRKLLERRTNEHIKIEDWRFVRRENLYYLNNLLTEWRMITKKDCSFSPNDVCRYDQKNIKKSLKKLKKELGGEDSSSKGDHENSVSHHQEPKHTVFEINKKVVYGWSSRHGPRRVHGFEHKVMSMERLVLRNLGAPLKVFGVVGVAGVGKTTLCQEIFRRPLVKKHFSLRIWVCLSKQPRARDGDDNRPRDDGENRPRDDNDDNRKEIVVRILQCLGIEDEVIGNAGSGNDALRRLILLLRLQLIGKTYLIVLDDAWNDDKFFENLTQKEHLDENWGEELAYALPKGCGGTVILSSRSEALVKKMIGKEASLQYLKPLKDEICEEIFKDTVTGYDDDEREFPDHLEDLKDDIRKKFEGLPLAAKLLARIARENLPPKPKPPAPTTSGGGAHENRPVLAAGPEHLIGDADAGGSGSGSGSGNQDSEHKSGVFPKSKHAGQKSKMVNPPEDPGQ